LAEIAYSSIHANDKEMIAKAARVANLSGDALISVDRQGRPVPLGR
jgi:hypothetical protein